MKVMKVLDKKTDKATYYKYRVNLPKEIVEDLKLEGKEVKIFRHGNKIIIEKEN